MCVCVCVWGGAVQVTGVRVCVCVCVAKQEHLKVNLTSTGINNQQKICLTRLVTDRTPRTSRGCTRS